MPELTDTHLVILSAAAARPGGNVLPVPASLKVKGAALTRTLQGLRKRGLLDERPAARNSVSWREDEGGRRMMLVISEPGLQAIDGGSAKVRTKRSVPDKADARKPRKRSGRPAAPVAIKPNSAVRAIRPGTKLALLIGLVARKGGASLDEIREATNWQPHSIRGAVSGTLRKKLDLAVVSEWIEGRGRVYRIQEKG